MAQKQVDNNSVFTIAIIKRKLNQYLYFTRNFIFDENDSIGNKRVGVPIGDVPWLIHVLTTTDYKHGGVKRERYFLIVDKYDDCTIISVKKSGKWQTMRLSNEEVNKFVNQLTNMSFLPSGEIEGKVEYNNPYFALT
jgi:hypothetical protein